MTIAFTTLAFIIFIAYVEQYALRIRYKALRDSVYKTWGCADWVYPVTRKQQTWMRKNIVQTYK